MKIMKITKEKRDEIIGRAISVGIFSLFVLNSAIFVDALNNRTVQDDYLNKTMFIDLNGDVWKSYNDFEIYTYNKEMNEQGMYETLDGEMVSLDELSKDDVIYTYELMSNSEILKASVIDDIETYDCVDAYPVREVKREKHSVNYIYEDVDININNKEKKLHLFK